MKAVYSTFILHLDFAQAYLEIDEQTLSTATFSVTLIMQFAFNSI